MSDNSLISHRFIVRTDSDKVHSSYFFRFFSHPTLLDVEFPIFMFFFCPYFQWISLQGICDNVRPRVWSPVYYHTLYGFQAKKIKNFNFFVFKRAREKRVCVCFNAFFNALVVVFVTFYYYYWFDNTMMPLCEGVK